MKRIVLLLVTLLFSAFALAAVNINTATKEELDALPGIGPVKAQAIIDYRKANGPFKSVEDIMKVPGIKEGTFGPLKDKISVSGPSTPAAAPAAKDARAAPAAATAPPAATPAPAAPAKAPETKMAAPAPAAAAASKTDAKKNEKATKADEKKGEKATLTDEKTAKDGSSKDSKDKKGAKSGKDDKAVDDKAKK